MSIEPSLPAPRVAAPLILAGAIAALGWFALSVEFALSLHTSFREGRTILGALFVFFRFFTILTNLGIALLMTTTLWRGLRGRPLPSARPYAAMLVYLVVVCVTYEALLRALWSPKGILFVTDMTMHDIVPVLTLAFWLVFAPKASLAWSDPIRWLEFPAVYFAVTVTAGLLGAGYPYGFLDADVLSVHDLVRNVLVFLVFFYGLGMATIAAARALSREKASPEHFERRANAYQPDDST